MRDSETGGQRDSAAALIPSISPSLFLFGGGALDIIESQIAANDLQFTAQAAYNRQLAQALREHVKIARQGADYDRVRVV